jgi:hypothetical protein
MFFKQVSRKIAQGVATAMCRAENYPPRSQNLKVRWEIFTLPPTAADITILMDTGHDYNGGRLQLH